MVDAVAERPYHAFHGRYGTTMQTGLPTLMAEVAKNMIAQLVPEGTTANPAEIEAVTAVCMMGVYRAGTEDPKAMLRPVSDPLIEHLVKSLGKARENRSLAKVSQFFLMEWCFRNGYMEDDWRWEWADKNEGRIVYRMRLPLEMIPIPTG